MIYFDLYPARLKKWSLRRTLKLKQLKLFYVLLCSQVDSLMYF